METEHFFATGCPFTLCLLHRQHTPSISDAVQRLPKIFEHEAYDEQWTRLLPMQKSIAHIVRMLWSNKSLKRRIDHALADFN